MPVPSASGYGGLENTPLARIGYYNKIISQGWEAEFLPYITNTSIDERITRCNQVVQFTKQPLVGEWKPYEKNQELVPDYVSPDSFCMEICNAGYKAIKFDKLDIREACDRWAAFEESFLQSTYETLAMTWRAFVLNGMILEAAASNKGARAGCAKNINLGTAGAPIAITGENFAQEVARLKRVLTDANRWVDGQMVLILPQAIWEIIVTSPYANAMQLGQCTDCSLLVTGKLPGTILGFDVFTVNCAPNAIDSATGNVAYYIIAAHREAFAFVGDIVEGELVRPSRYFGLEYQMLAVWGGKAIYPDAIAVAYWTF